MTKFLLDSGDPQEYREIAQLAKEQGSELWGSTTNPSLIAKSVSRRIAASGKKLTPKEAFALQKEIILEIIEIVPGAVSGEVYASQTTTAEEMIEQGREIASWHERVVVKLPTTLEGFKARETLRKEGIIINNTLVFSQQQVYAICLQEMLLQKEKAKQGTWPPFISPFLGRLDDKGEDGIALLDDVLRVKNTYFDPHITWMLAASIRNTYHLKKTLESNSELATIPAKVLREWFALTDEQRQALTEPTPNLVKIPSWTPPEALKNIQTLDGFTAAITDGTLDISHPLTTAGIDKFVADWNTILLQ